MKIEVVEGIGPAYAANLAAAGVTSTDVLLEQGWIDAAKDLPRVVEH